MYDVLSILEALLDVLPSNNTLVTLGIMASRDGNDLGVRLGPECL